MNDLITLAEKPSMTRALTLLTIRLTEHLDQHEADLTADDQVLIQKTVTAAEWLAVMLSEDPNVRQDEDISPHLSSLFSTITTVWARDDVVSLIRVLSMYGILTELIALIYRVQDRRRHSHLRLTFFKNK